MSSPYLAGRNIYEEPMDALQFCLGTGMKSPVLESVILEDAECAYYYARDVIRGRWEEAEDIILDDMAWGYEYLINIVQVKDKDIESKIYTNPYLSYSYAVDVINDRFIPAEQYIMADEEYGSMYTRHILNR